MSSEGEKREGHCTFRGSLNENTNQNDWSASCGPTAVSISLYTWAKLNVVMNL